MLDFRLSHKETEHLVEYSRDLFLQKFGANTATKIFDDWEKILLNEIDRNILIAPSSNDQLFEQDLTLGTINLHLILDSGRTRKLAKKHLSPHMIPIENFIATTESPAIPKYAYTVKEVSADYPKNSSPIIIAPIDINPLYVGFVIDGNHRVSTSAKFTNEPMPTFICSEGMAVASFLSYYQKALYLFIQEVFSILSLELDGISNYTSNRIEYLQGLLKNL